MLYVLLALLTGLIIGTSRAVNGRLSTRIGAFRASVWNHVVGFAFLSVVLLALRSWPDAGGAPVAAYLGGVFGALFVAVNSHVFPRLGAVNASLWVISGQVLSAVTIDCVQQRSLPTTIRFLGVALVLLGLCLPRMGARIRRAGRRRRAYWPRRGSARPRPDQGSPYHGLANTDPPDSGLPR